MAGPRTADRSAVHRRSARRRSRSEWGVRILLASVAGLVGSIGVGHALATSLQAIGQVERAHVLAPDDARITALLAQRRAGADATRADRARADMLARRALRRDATAVDAVSTLGIDAQIRGDTASARRLFAYSQRLSRRDLQTQLWAIEDAVGRGDVARALRGYDVALRTSLRASDLLFPVLASAIAEPAVRDALVRTLADRPVWSPGFTDYVAGSDPDPRSTVALFRDLHRAGIIVSEHARAALIGSLITGRMLADAWSYYALLHPGADRRRSRDPAFAGSASPSPLDWVPTDDGTISTSIQRGERGGVLDVSVPPSIGGVLASQMQMLPPGDYRLQGRSANLDQPANSRPYWVLSCSDGHEFGRVVMPNSVQDGGLFAGRLTVPAGCPLQVLALVARPSDSVSGIAGQIERVELRPVR